MRRRSKICKQCGKSFYVRPSHAPKRECCSITCSSILRQESTKGENNPNFKGGGKKTCAYCGKEYISYDSRRKYCSTGCYNSTRIAKPKKLPQSTPKLVRLRS